MKSLKWPGIALLATLAASLGYAQFPPRARFDVPFDFSIDRTTFPAGEYFVSHIVGTGLVALESRDGRSHMFMSVIAGHRLDQQERSQIVFHRYGDTYFLSSIRYATELDSLDLRKSRAERELAGKIATASNLPSGEVVLAAVR